MLCTNPVWLLNPGNLEDNMIMKALVDI